MIIYSFCFEGDISFVLLPVPQTKFVLLLVAKLLRLTFVPNQLVVEMFGFQRRLYWFAAMPASHPQMVESGVD
jgi:hypothetical protein